jgi:hypothetical protein
VLNFGGQVGDLIVYDHDSVAIVLPRGALFLITDFQTILPVDELGNPVEGGFGTLANYGGSYFFSWRKSVRRRGIGG